MAVKIDKRDLPASDAVPALMFAGCCFKKMVNDKAECDGSLCIDCGACIATCQVQAISE